MGFDSRVETVAAPPRRTETRPPIWIAGVVVAGAVVALTVGVVARVFQSDSPSGYFQLWWDDPIHLKIWFATFAALGAFVQVLLAAWIFRQLPWPRPSWVPALHRWTGRLTFLCTLPVAYHCIFKLGFHTDRGDRVLIHSFLGAAFFGAYTTKVTIVRLHRFPTWVLPAAGGVLFAVLIGLWYTSSYWFFTTVDANF
jgi:Family of unknown function (DUF6529)